MGIYKYDTYRSPNIGIFLKANDNFLFVPRGFANSKAAKLEGFLNARCVNMSVAQTRLVGPLMIVNNNGILLPRIAYDEEVEDLKKATGMNVARLESRLTSLGNLIALNDRAAIVSPMLPEDVLKQIRDILGVQTHSMYVASYHQVGVMIACTNVGAAVHPKTTDEEIATIRDVLGVDVVEPATVNGGVPFVAAGAVANSRSAVVGSLTTGPELMMLSRAFKI
ncbi:MAG: translation initiation factor IF-6 [Nitrososphaerales archaeon]